jgi:phage anti-repressor protein
MKGNKKMQKIIQITKNEIGNAELNSVNARDIHNYLQVNSKFADWIKRAISKYDFKENIDYVCFLKNEKAGNNAISKEYIVTMDMAKELAMLENNPKGKETRKYFINCEKELQKSSPYANLQEIVAFQKKQLDQLQGIGDILINQQVQMSNLANIVTNLSKQNLCDVAQNEQSNKKVIKNKDTINIDFKISRDFTDFYDLNYIELEILKVLIEKNEFLDKKVIDGKNYFKLTLKMMVEFSSVKEKESTICIILKL